MIERQDKIELDIQEIKKYIENMKKDNVKDRVNFADILKKRQLKSYWKAKKD